MRPELEKKIKSAIKLLQSISALKNGEPVEVAYSGGKDSDTILQLVKEAGINCRAIYKNTTIDPPGTIAHAIEMGAEIRRPKNTFFKLIRKKGMPSRFSRFCCAELKEYKILDTCVIGVRREESTKRAAMYKEPTVCRVYSKTERVEQILPILEWTLQDVAEFLEDRKIKLAPVYYDETGKVHYERRLGCLGCPLVNETKQLEEFKKYPNLAKQWCKAQKVFRDTHPNCKSVKLYEDEYENFCFNVLKRKMAKIPTNKKALFKTDYKQFLQDLLNITF